MDERSESWGVADIQTAEGTGLTPWMSRLWQTCFALSLVVLWFAIGKDPGVTWFGVPPVLVPLSLTLTAIWIKAAYTVRIQAPSRTAMLLTAVLLTCGGIVAALAMLILIRAL